MHELSIAEALRQTLLEYQQENGGKVLRLFVSIGRLGGIDPEALEYVWPMAMGECDENVRHCQLVIKSLDIEFECGGCGKKVYAKHWIGRCPHCQNETLRRLGGRELSITGIEVENV
ncbi:MAG: hydrogenase maturation nickel metallochaperone HypA [Lentisphaeria bacterium]|nr:hydrogenase maturation nickel metallochaperone HypA [Lentisphaeria bacterium]